MKAMKAAPASGAALARGHGRAVDGRELNVGRQRPDDRQAVGVDHLALGIEADLSLAARHQLDAAASAER